MAHEPAAARKRKVNDEDEETEAPAMKRGKASSSVANSAVSGKTAAVPASSPVKSAAKPSAAAAAAGKKSIVGGRPSGSKVSIIVAAMPIHCGPTDFFFVHHCHRSPLMRKTKSVNTRPMRKRKTVRLIPAKLWRC